jgi:hypothetical protein
VGTGAARASHTLLLTGGMAGEHSVGAVFLLQGRRPYTASSVYTSRAQIFLTLICTYLRKINMALL